MHSLRVHKVSIDTAWLVQVQLCGMYPKLQVPRCSDKYFLVCLPTFLMNVHTIMLFAFVMVQKSVIFNPIQLYRSLVGILMIVIIIIARIKKVKKILGRVSQFFINLGKRSQFT